MNELYIKLVSDLTFNGNITKNTVDKKQKTKKNYTNSLFRDFTLSENKNFLKGVCRYEKSQVTTPQMIRSPPH